MTSFMPDMSRSIVSATVESVSTSTRYSRNWSDLSTCPICSQVGPSSACIDLGRRRLAHLLRLHGDLLRLRLILHASGT